MNVNLVSLAMVSSAMKLMSAKSVPMIATIMHSVSTPRDPLLVGVSKDTEVMVSDAMISMNALMDNIHVTRMRNVSIPMVRLHVSVIKASLEMEYHARILMNVKVVITVLPLQPVETLLVDLVVNVLMVLLDQVKYVWTLMNVRTDHIHVMKMLLVQIYPVVSIALVIMVSLVMDQNALTSMNVHQIEITVTPMPNAQIVLAHSHVPVELDSPVTVSHVLMLTNV